MWRHRSSKLSPPECDRFQLPDRHRFREPGRGIGARTLSRPTPATKPAGFVVSCRRKPLLARKKVWSHGARCRHLIRHYPSCGFRWNGIARLPIPPVALLLRVRCLFADDDPFRCNRGGSLRCVGSIGLRPSHFLDRGTRCHQPTAFPIYTGCVRTLHTALSWRSSPETTNPI